ncbi:MAG: AbrB/MazE/SpoVT family DNA-binding domain-containing protein [Candidatus Hodarchaeales archaeon]
MTEETLTKVNKRFSIVIPKKIREGIDLKEGDIVRIQRQNNKIIITPEKHSFYERCYQIMGDIRYTENLEEEIDELGLDISKLKKSWEK